MKKQTLKAWAMVSPITGQVGFEVGYPWQLRVFPSKQTARDEAKSWCPPFLVQRVEVTIKPIKPKQARKRPSKWTVRMGNPVPSTEWLQIAEPKTKRCKRRK